MIAVSSEPPAAVFTAFVRGWFALLARGSFEQAAALLDEPNSYGQRWGAEEIVSVLRGYGHGTAPAVSDPDTLPEVGGCPDLVAFADGSGYNFDHHLPLRGEWSDLTAQFEFLHRPGGFAVVLHDIHVL